MCLIDRKPGPELDMAVAEALGWKFELVADYRREIGLHLWVDSDGQQQEFGIPSFSTDLNAAFSAAEEVSLFAYDEINAKLKMTHQGWMVEWRCDLVDEDTEVIADTPALAICSAILKLKENST